jgi:hypothetical protein
VAAIRHRVETRNLARKHQPGGGAEEEEEEGGMERATV